MNRFHTRRVRGKWAAKTAALCLALGVAVPLLSNLPTAELPAQVVSAATTHDEDLVLRYGTMAGYTSANNAWSNDESFYRALPLGNGRIGAMVYGNCPDEWIDLNECTVWSAGPGNNNHAGAADSLERVQSMLAAGDYRGANSVIGQNMIGGGQAKYQMVGTLKLALGHENVSNYQRQLDMNTGVATTTYTWNGKQYRRETLVSHPDQVMVTRISCEAAGSVSVTGSYTGVLNGGVTTDGSDTLVANGHGDKDLGINGAVYFSSRSQFLPTGGTVRAANGTVSVSGADSVLILTSVRTNFVDAKTCNGDEKGDAAKDLTKARAIPYETLLANHTADFTELFGRVDVDLGGDSAVSNAKAMSTRIAEFTKTNDPKMVKVLFQYGRYLMISASRDAQAMNLQGIWNKYSFPAWGSKATTNINYEMNYWPAFTTNLAECFEPFVEKAKALQVTGNETAKAHYGISEGWVLHHNTDLWNRTAPIDGTWGQWPVGGAWVSNMLYDAYRFNRDEDYLAEVYPVIQGSAAFLNQLMKPVTIGQQEYMAISPSASPELPMPGYAWDDNVYCGYSVTMDNGICRELFSDVVEAASILRRDPTLSSQLQAKLSLIRPSTIGKWGQIQEWAYDWDNQNEKHRHISHLYALYPGLEISPYTNAVSSKAAATSLNARGDAGTGWSEAWKLNCWARLQDAAHAYNLIRLLITPVNGSESGRLYENLWDAHPPFQIDGNFGFTAGVAEMLLQSHSDLIQLLPALPNEWATGHANGLCARGNFEISEMDWENGKLRNVSILSKSGGVCNLKYGNAQISFETKAGETYALNGNLQFREAEDVLQNLALNAKASASGAEAGETAAMAFDNDATTKWCHMDGMSGEWLQVDLGSVRTIQRWTAQFAGTAESIDYNPRDMKLQASTDGTQWLDVDSVYGNTMSTLNRNVKPFAAQYVRLSMVTATQNKSGGARVYDLALWGTERAPEPSSPFFPIEAETFNFMSGEIQTETGDTGVTNIGFITDGSYVVYRSLDFETGAKGFRARVASNSEGGTITLRAGAPDGKLLGSVTVPPTDGWQSYQMVDCALAACTGVQDLYLCFSGSSDFLLNLDWFTCYGTKGDVNCDGKVDARDLTLCKRGTADADSFASALARANADVDWDNAATKADCTLLQAFLLGKQNAFPAPSD